MVLTWGLLLPKLKFVEFAYMLGSAPGVMAVLLRTISSKVGVGWVTTMMEKVKAMMLD